MAELCSSLYTSPDSGCRCQFLPFYQWRNLTVNSQFNWKKREAKTWHPDKLTLKVRLSICCKSFCCLWFCFTYFVVHRARVSYRTVSVTPSTPVGTKAWACHTKAAMPVFVLPIKYAHIHEIGVILSVSWPCTCAYVIALFPVFPWRVTKVPFWLLKFAVCMQHFNHFFAVCMRRFNQVLQRQAIKLNILRVF